MPGPEIDASFEESSSTLVLSGELDQDQTEALRELLTATSADFSRSLAVDLGAVTYLPSSAIGVLVSGMGQAARAGHELKLVAPRGSTAAVVLGVSGLPFDDR